LTLLRILAETGVARRSVAAGMFAEEQGIQSPGSGTVSRAFQRFERKELIELIRAKSETVGSGTYYLIRLTEKGRDACRMLLGRDAVPSQFAELLERHKTPEHTLLNLEAGDLLREAGYEVDLFPSETILPGDRLVAPDLSALSPYGELLLVEVERDTKKHDRRRKWEKCRDANGGALYVVVANESALNKVKSEILFWAGRSPLKLWMSSISDDMGKQGEDVWSFKRG
jgi:DNA-binding PadR family transcriptional regulator